MALASLAELVLSNNPPLLELLKEVPGGNEAGKGGKTGGEVGRNAGSLHFLQGRCRVKGNQGRQDRASHRAMITKSSSISLLASTAALYFPTASSRGITSFPLTKPHRLGKGWS